MQRLPVCRLLVRCTDSEQSRKVPVGHLDEPGKLFSESDWTRVEGADCSAYVKSKTLAERAAWEFVQKLPGEEALELVTMNPGFIIGPMLGGTDCSSADVIGRFLDPDLPAIPRLKMEYIDVRDTAMAHVLAMEVLQQMSFLLSG